MLLSIIIPVYNAEPYLEDCINSVLNQTYRNIEILIVNDGSTDKSSIICEKFKAFDSRIKVIHKRNEGLSSARNAGIRYSSGDFIGFVDADDTIDSKMYELLLDQLTKNNADISACEMNKIDLQNNTNGYSPDFHILSPITTFDNKTALKLLIQRKIDCSACNKLFKSQLFKNIEFKLGRYNEDFLLLSQLYLEELKIVYLNTPLYNYFNRTNSLTSFKFSNKDFDLIKNATEILIQIEAKFPELKNIMTSYLFKSKFDVYCKLLLNDTSDVFRNDRELLRKELKHNLYYILTDRTCVINHPFFFILSLFFPSIYGFLFKHFYFFIPLHRFVFPRH